MQDCNLSMSPSVDLPFNSYFYLCDEVLQVNVKLENMNIIQPGIQPNQPETVSVLKPSVVTI